MKFGTHFCSGEPVTRLDDPFPEYRDSTWFRLLKRILVVLIASGLVLGLLRGTIGFPAYILIGLLTAGVVTVIVIRELMTGGNPEKLEPTNAGNRSRGYREVVKMLHGDRETADRLINDEMSRYPDFTRQDCIRRVHDRLIYERSR